MATSAPANVNNPPNPQVSLGTSTVTNVNEAKFRQTDPAGYRAYEAYKVQAVQALTEKYIAEGDSPGLARDQALIEADLAADRQFAPQIQAAGAGGSAPATTPLLAQQPQPPNGPVTPVNPAANPQVPAATPTPPPGRPLLPLRDDGGSFNRLVGDVREDGAVLTQFLSNGTPVFVIRPAETTPAAVAPAANPQVPPPPRALPNPAPGESRLVNTPEDFGPVTNPPIVAPAAQDFGSDPQIGLPPPQDFGDGPPAVVAPAAVAVDPADITGDESAFVPTSPTPAAVAPAANPQVPAAQDLGSDPPIVVPAAQDFGSDPEIGLPPAQDLGSDPLIVVPAAQDFGVDPQVPRDTPPPDPAVPSPGQADQDLANQTFANRENAKLQATIQAQRKQANDGDWRVKLRLAAGANYLYKATEPGILEPLSVSDGVVFPYTPKINTSYSATYSATDLTHSNYKGYFYQGSSVGEVKISATFTAQDTFEANYLLAVIHFFRSVTKMFYGQDQQYRGAPPPLVFLQGLGEYQFNLHPCVVSQFDYVLPDDVDYIRARSVSVNGTNLLQKRDRQTVSNGSDSTSAGRLQGAGLSAGGIFIPPPPPTLGIDKPTYVPTKMEISITLLPIQTRAQLSQEFSLAKFANGNLVRGGYW